MMRSIYLKTLYDKRFFILGWFVGFVALAALMTSFFPAMRTTGLDELVKNLPPAFKGLVGDLALLENFDTYLASQLFDIRVPLIAGIMAIILGLGLSISEEESGELRTFTALPISRTSLLIQKWLAMATIVTITSAGFVVGTYAVIPFIEDASIGAKEFLSLITMTLLIMIAYGTIPFASAFAFGRRSLASFIAIFVIIGGFIISTFASAVDWLKDYEKLSLLHYFPATDIVTEGIAPRDVMVLGGTTLILLAMAIILFRRRDIA
jgi:ABC-2 type transport system permease protein